jgi:hypothetical protein
VAFTWDKAALDAAGLVLEPEHAVKLAAAPEYGSLDVALTLNTARKGVGMGALEATAALPVKGGLPVLLSVRAEVVLPGLQLSQEALDFGCVRHGQCKVGRLPAAAVVACAAAPLHCRSAACLPWLQARGWGLGRGGWIGTALGCFASGLECLAAGPRLPAGRLSD